MDRTVIGLYSDFDTARQVVEELVEAGVPREKISLVANDSSNTYSGYLNRSNADVEDDVSGSEGAGFGAVVGALVGLGAMLIPGIGPVIGAGPLVAGLAGAGVGAATGAVTGGITASLLNIGVDEETAGYYAEGIRRGGTLVAVQGDESRMDSIMSIMSQYNPIDINTRVEQWRQSGWSGFDQQSQPYNTAQIELERGQATQVDDEVRAQVVEEELQVGKRQVERGGVRLRTFVTETPVQEQVNLREEHVTVERRPVNRQASAADLTTGEQTYEFTERAEEAVVSKTARVVEEVVVKKDVEEHTETISDTVRRKDVEVERTGAASSRAFDSYANNFRQHYNTTYGNRGQSYEYYMPAYQYGYTLASDQRYRQYNNWNDVESYAQQGWSQDQGPWEDFKDAVRHAWNSIRGVE